MGVVVLWGLHINLIPNKDLCLSVSLAFCSANTEEGRTVADGRTLTNARVNEFVGFSNCFTIRGWTAVVA